ncbi:MAG: leucine-rich repeat domain-containing protein [Candidatus Cyclobacteriaceae bacterium M3_2C_046]
MKRFFPYILIFITGLAGFPLATVAQDNQPSLSEQEIENYTDKVRQLVSFLEFALNTIGNKNTTTREKEIIINQSYLKVFAHEDVQIEDDLDDHREVVTNKNVQAYLKDVDFFFQDVSFEFNVEDISHYVNQQGQVYFRVNLSRVMNGVTLNNDTINSIKRRFIEVNINEAEQDLKIASIYTTKLSQKEELENWWSSLSYEWKAVFKRDFAIYDTISFEQLKNIVSIEKIDVSNNKYINDLTGLGKLTELKELDISHTEVDNLIPLRNLTKLEHLNCAYTNISSLDPLKYALNLRNLICNNTQLMSLATAENLVRLEKLHGQNNEINDLTPIKSLSHLKELNLAETAIVELSALDSLFQLNLLNLARTYIYSLDPLKSLVNLQELNFSGTHVRSIDSLHQLDNLKIISCNNTPLSNLEAFGKLPSLERIYCDNTLITKSQANQFMLENPNVLVIFKSDVLLNWWNILSDDWKKAFQNLVPINGSPEKEQLAQLAQITSIDISNNPQINSLEPLMVLENLKQLNCAHTGVTDLSPLRELEKLEYLNCENTSIQTLDPISYLRELKVLNIENTPVSSLIPILYHRELEILYLDNTNLEEKKIQEFWLKNPDCLVIYKTEKLASWWNEISPAWRAIFNKHLMAINISPTLKDHIQPSPMSDTIPSKEDLHRIANLRIISVQNNHQINDLFPLAELKLLKSLQIANTGVSSLDPIAGNEKLESIDCSENPIYQINALRSLDNLTYLNLANTPIEDLEPVERLYQLKELDCSGTQIRNLDDLSGLTNLTFLNCSNTFIRNLKAIEDHPNLQKLICYNTRISQRRLQGFLEDHPNVEVKYY